MSDEPATLHGFTIDEIAELYRQATEDLRDQCTVSTRHWLEAKRLEDEARDLRAIRDAALALSRAVEPADLSPAARPALLTLRALLAAGGVDPVG